MISLACPHCDQSEKVIKFGANRSGSVRYRCGYCGKTFTPRSSQPCHDRRQRSPDCCPVARAGLPTWHCTSTSCRTPNHSGTPKKRADALEVRLMQHALARLPAPQDDVLEVDELCLRQTPALWVWLIVSRLTRQVLSFALGDRTDALLETAWACIPADYRDTPVCTDHWGAYDRFFSDAQHTACDKGSGLTSIVEGLNTKWRQRQSGMVRRSCGVHPKITDDIFERFLLLLDNHNQHCERRWLRKMAVETTQQNP